MKSTRATNSTSPFASQISGIMLELSKYRLNPTKTDTNSTAKKPQTVIKPVAFQSRKNTQPETKIAQHRINTVQPRSPAVSGRKPSFSVFFPKEDETSLSMPNLSEIILTTEQDASCDHDKVDKRQEKEKSTPKRKIGAKNVMKRQTQPKAQVWSFLDLSDKEDEGNTSIMGSSNNVDARKSVFGMRSSYMTTMPTLPDDDREEINRRCNTEVLDTRTEVSSQNNEKALRARIKELEEKNGKWELFGRLIIGCYQSTRKERNDYRMQNELNKKSIAALKEQVGTLRTLSKIDKANAAKAAKKAAQESEENKFSLMTLSHLEEQLKALTSENRKLKQQMSALKEETKEKNKTSQEALERYKTSAEHYKTVAEEKLKECSAFAEEIICLRTDLDRLHLKYLKVQKELNGSTTPSAGKNTSDEEEENKKIKVIKNRTKSMDRHSMEKLVTSQSTEGSSSARHVVFWEPAVEEIDTPSPRALKAKPLRKDSNSLMKE